MSHRGVGWERDPLAPMSLDSLKQGLAWGQARSRCLKSLKAKGKAKAKAPIVEDPIPVEGRDATHVWDPMN